ncbi:unnamed protein product, partial [Choristocarpus tenellus]
MRGCVQSVSRREWGGGWRQPLLDCVGSLGGLYLLGVSTLLIRHSFCRRYVGPRRPSFILQHGSFCRRSTSVIDLGSICLKNLCQCCRAPNRFPFLFYSHGTEIFS